jgi:hypothetical protein
VSSTRTIANFYKTLAGPELGHVLALSASLLR